MPNGAGFCGSCGTKTETPNTGFGNLGGYPVPPAPVQKMKKPFPLLKILIPSAVGVAVIAAAIVAVIMFAKPSHPTAVLKDSITKTLEVSGAEFGFKLKEDDEIVLKGSGFFSLGNNLNSSAFSVTVTDYDDDKSRYAIYKGNAASMENYGYSDWYDFNYDIGDENIYPLDITYNDFIKDGKINFDLIRDLIDETADNEFAGPRMPKQAWDQMDKFITEFFEKECGNSEVMGNVLQNLDITKESGRTTYSFNVKPDKAIVAFLEYAENNIGKYKDLEKYLNSVIADIDMRDYGIVVDDIGDLISFAKSSGKIMLKGIFEDYKIKCSVTVNENRLVSSFVLKIDDTSYYGGKYEISVNIMNHNVVQFDSDELESFMDRAERESF